MVDVVVKALYIALNEPLYGCEWLLYADKCGMATASGSEPVRSMLKTAFVNRTQNHPYHFLHQFIVKRRYAERTFFTVFLRYVRPFGRNWLISLVFQTFNQLFNAFNAHSVDGLAVGSCRHVTRFRINALIGYMKHFFIKQNSIQPLKLVAWITAVFRQTV